jgi:TPR repeat protein
VRKIILLLTVWLSPVSVIFAQQPAGPGGSGIASDEREIVFKERLMKAVGGDVDAQIFIAESYLLGRFPAGKDEQMGLVWLEKAALAGNKKAATQIALWHLNKPNGKTSPELIIEWVKWFSISEGKLYANNEISDLTLSRGHAKAQAVWDKHPELRSGVPKSTPLVDERNVKFNELLAKAESGDARAQYEVGLAYETGSYPVEKDSIKGREWIEKSALSGNPSAAGDMARWCYRQPNGSTDVNLVAERVKWYSIQTGALFRNSEISEATLAEGHRRAEALWIERPNLLKRSSFNNNSPVRSGYLSSQEAELPRVSNISQFNDMRRGIVSAYLKAASPIYNKGDLASPEEQKAFISAAIQLKALQAYTKKKPVRYKSSGKKDPMLQVNQAKVKEAYDRMSYANIKAEFPCSRVEQNEASKYISALNDLMSLPVDFGSSY